MTIKDLGYSCKCWRRGADITQKQMAVNMNKSPESVSAFECGRNDSAMMLMYYIAAGYPIEDFLKEKVLPWPRKQDTNVSTHMLPESQHANFWIPT